MGNSLPAIYNGNVYIGSYDAFLYAIDMETRELVWRFKAGDFIFSGPAIDEKNGIVYFGSKDSYIYAVSARDGKEIWRFKTMDEIMSFPTLYNGKLLIGSLDGYLYCIDAYSGREEWRFKTGGEIVQRFELPVANGMIYFCSFDNYLYALTLDGKEVWRFQLGKYGSSGVPALYKGVLYHGDREGIFYAIEANSGKEVWRFYASKKPISQKPLIFNEKVYFGSDDCNLYCLDLNGNEMWRFKTEGIVGVPPVVYKNMLLVASFDCRVYAIDLVTREEIWRFATSTMQQSYFPPAYEAWETKVKTDTHKEEMEEGKEDKYARSLAMGEFDSYKAKSEYAMKSEYTSKSEYK
ncbi:MAG TPA: hypothetical protein ENG42_00995 [Candidatus Aenigmarchaeota archaeon]|nr:hypothetical protein [Candidatus Aenigmarchaeota archaeon]